MTQPAKVQEPSMEEILASIRRIIADDEAKPPAEKPSSPAASVAPAKPQKPATPPPAAKPSVMSDIPPSAIPAAITAAAKVAAPPRPAPTPAAPPPPPAAASNNQDDIDALLNGLDEATSPEEIRSTQPDGEVLELTDEMAVPAAPQPSFRKVEPQDDLEFTEAAAARAVQRQPLFQTPPVFEGPAAPPAAAILSRSNPVQVTSS